MFFDCCGHRIAVANDEARLAWDATLEAVLAHAAAAPEHLGRTLAADPRSGARFAERATKRTHSS